MSGAAILNQPIDLAAPLQPTRILFVHALAGRAHSEIFDCTSQLQWSYTSDIDSHLLESAQSTLKANSATKPIWHLAKSKWYSNSRISVISPAAAGGERASWHSPILRYGTTKISFPLDSPHCTHGLEVTPLKLINSGMGFVLENISYVWQLSELPESAMDAKSGRLSLFKATSGAPGAKKFEIARYRSASGRFESGGVIVVDAREVDVLVAVLTLLATLNQRDPFSRPGIGRARSSSMVDASMGFATPV